MTTKNKHIARPCLLCEIGANLSSYHVMKHETEPKTFQAFQDQLLKEPIREFIHPDFKTIDMQCYKYLDFDDYETLGFVDIKEDDCMLELFHDDIEME